MYVKLALIVGLSLAAVIGMFCLGKAMDDKNEKSAGE